MNQLMINDRDGLAYLRYFFNTHSIHVQYCSDRICKCDEGLDPEKYLSKSDLTLEERRDQPYGSELALDKNDILDYEIANPGFTLSKDGWIIEKDEVSKID